MLSLLMTISVLNQTPRLHEESRWIRQALTIKVKYRVPVVKQFAPQAIAKQPGRLSPDTSGIRSLHAQGVLPVDPDFIANYKVLNPAVHHVAELIDEGNPQAADAYLIELRQSNPKLLLLMRPLAVETELLSGHYDQAFSDAAEFIRQNLHPLTTSDSDPSFLYLSLAAAGLGHVYPGQWEFCAQQLKQHQLAPEPIQLSPSSEDPKKVMELSAMALAMGPTHFSQQYLELALKLDPRNELAGRLAVDYDDVQGRYSDLRRIASSMVSNLHDQKSGKFFESRIKAVTGLPDRPKVSKITTISP